MDPLPAHRTKHLPAIAYPVLGRTFHLAQSDDGRSSGTALWLGAQILSFYLLQLPLPKDRRPRAVELGSGVGLTACVRRPFVAALLNPDSLVLGALGYDVLATDTRHVCDSVLRRNIAVNLPHLPPTAGVIQVRELDWNVETETVPPFDLILSSDTLYDPSLVQPFFRTVRALAAAGRGVASVKRPVLLLALERRDPQLIDAALACAPVPLTQVATRKVRRAVERAGAGWDASEWEGVEIWRATL